jgi:mannose-6-phosphate isomerase-like protein (cupin superfamily)
MEGMTMWPLSQQTGGGLRAYKIAVSGRRRRPPETLPVHEGQEWLYVITGRLRLLLGDDEHVIEPGEAVEFSTWTPHWFGAVDRPVELLAIFGADGERIHVRS